MNNKTTVTTLNVSVGADNGQSQSVTKHSNSITDNNCVRNLQSTGTPVKIWKQYQWKNFMTRYIRLRSPWLRI